MKKIFLMIAMTGLLAGAASAEWDFDVHGAQIAQPRQCLSQAQHVTFLAGLQLELGQPVTAWDTTEKAVDFAIRGFAEAVQQTAPEAADR